MTENENSSNKRQNIERTDMQIDPWLQMRLEERANPPVLRRPTVGKANLLSSGSQQLLLLGQAGQRLASHVMKHTGLSSLISRAASLPFLSRASRNIVKKSVISESPHSYTMLDLPWFNPEQNMRQNYINESGLSPQGRPDSNITFVSTDTLSHRPSESAKEKTIIRHEKKPEPYINRLISPVITRKPTEDITSRIVGRSFGEGPSVQTRQKAAVTYPVFPNKSPETTNTNSPDRKTEIVTPKPIISTKSETDTGKLRSLQSHMTEESIIKANDTGSSGRLPIELATEKTHKMDRNTKDVHSGPPLELRETLSGTSKSQPDKPVETAEFSPKDVTTALNRTSSPVNSDSGKKKVMDSYDTQPSIAMEQIAATTEKQQISKSSGIGKNRPEKKVRQIYPAQELVHRKPVSIGKRIVRSLPIIRNISRKDDRIPKIPSSNAEKSLNRGDTKLSSKQTEMVHPVEESTRTLPDSDRFTSFSGTDKAKAESQLPISEAKEVGNEILAAETPQPTVSHDSEDRVLGERTYQSYPVEESVQRKPIPIGQRSMRILPLAGGVSSEISQPSEDIFSLGAKLFESEVIPAQKTYDNPYIPVSSLPVTSPIISDTIPTAGSSETSVGRQVTVSGDFTKPSNRRLDLTLAPITHTTITTQQNSNPQTDDGTQYVQRLETSSSSQAATQTQTQQSQPQDTIQESQTRTAENNNQNINKPDIKALAREIYPLIRRMVIIERERRPSR